MMWDVLCIFCIRFLLNQTSTYGNFIPTGEWDVEFKRKFCLICSKDIRKRDLKGFCTQTQVNINTQIHTHTHTHTHKNQNIDCGPTRGWCRGSQRTASLAGSILHPGRWAGAERGRKHQHWESEEQSGERHISPLRPGGRPWLGDNSLGRLLGLDLTSGNLDVRKEETEGNPAVWIQQCCELLLPHHDSGWEHKHWVVDEVSSNFNFRF